MLRVLFICTHNRCRSILAEAMTRHIAGSRWQVASAGSQPAGVVYDGTLAFLRDNNISTDHLVSQSWDELGDFDPHVVVTVCDSAASESCPVWMGKALKVHWGLTDPSKIADEAEQQAAFERVAKQIDTSIRAVLAADLPEDDNVINTEQLQRVFAQATPSVI